MSYQERMEIIKKIEEIRGSKVLTYIISTRPKINTMIEPTDLRYFYDHLNDDEFQNKDIDLLIYSNGGVSTVAWALANLIREHANKFSVLIPYNAFSCATSIALGADEILMTKMGTLGPIDPTVSNPFNPIIKDQLVGISVEDMAGYISFIQDKFGINDTDNLTQACTQLTNDIRPLALGNAYRHYMKCRDDAKKLLNLHMSPENDKEKIENITSILVEKLYYHGHHVNRKEAKSIGLKVINPEELSSELSELMWQLYLDYETDLSINIPYRDAIPENGNKSELPIKYIESTSASHVYVIEQNWIKMDFPENSKLINNNGQPAVYLPTNQIIPAVFSGQPVYLNNNIYDKQEVDYWKKQD